MWRSPARLFVDEKRERIVPEDSPEARFLLVAEGGEIENEEAERYGLVEGVPRFVPTNRDPYAVPDWGSGLVPVDEREMAAQEPEEDLRRRVQRVSGTLDAAPPPPPPAPPGGSPFDTATGSTESASNAGDGSEPDPDPDGQEERGSTAPQRGPADPVNVNDAAAADAAGKAAQPDQNKARTAPDETK